MSGSSQQDAREAARLVGTTIAQKYLVRSIIGVGGNGIVFEAEDIMLRRKVAIKVPTGRRSVGRAAMRFRREARAGASISHANVCALYDFGVLGNGVPFIVMERLLGETLAARLSRDGALPLRLAIQVMQQVLGGLAAAHERGIIHRDMKPGNVFLTKLAARIPRAQVLDFGSSTLSRSEPGAEDDATELLTALGTAVGTPYYMAPEQVNGERDFDSRVDVFACGVILYEAVVGRRPFDGRNLRETFARILKGSPTPPTNIDPDLPRVLDGVLARAMAVDRGSRYASAEAFAAALATVPLKRLPSARMASPSTKPTDARLTYLQARFREVAVLHQRAAGREQGEVVPPGSSSTAEIPIIFEAEAREARAVIPSLAHDDDPNGTAPTEPKWITDEAARGSGAPRERLLRRRRR